MYEQANAGKLPDDFGVLLQTEDITAQVFICPKSTATPTTQQSPREISKDLQIPGHCSYIYLGKGLTAPLDSDRVLALEYPGNHDLDGDDGINVLYGDTHVEFVRKEVAIPMLNELGIDLGPWKQFAITQP